ncbi:unnamed protein product [Closterium sp. Yama58-4]|nr:unnamed protein product [Closterium sp. Yama58-4]
MFSGIDDYDRPSPCSPLPPCRSLFTLANKAMYSGIDDSDLLPAPLSLPAATTTDGTGTNGSVPAVQMPILIGPNEGANGEEEDGEGRRVGGRGDGAGDVAVIAGEGGRRRGGLSGGEGEGGKGKGDEGTRAEHWTAEEVEREAMEYETSTGKGKLGTGGEGKGQQAGESQQNQQQNQQQKEQLQLQVPGLISRAMLPRSQWVNLVMLDVIKERNRPIQPPKKPEQAPFFLPSVPTFSGAIHFAPPQAGTAGGSAEPAEAAGSAEPVATAAGAVDAGASGGSSGGALPGWGDEEDAEMEEGEEEEEGEEGSEEGEEGGEEGEEGGKKGSVLGKRRHGRVVRGGIEESEMDTELMRAIRRDAQCEPADYSQAMALLKAMSSSATDPITPPLSLPFAPLSPPHISYSPPLPDSQAMALLKAMSPSSIDLDVFLIQSPCLPFENSQKRLRLSFLFSPILPSLSPHLPLSFLSDSQAMALLKAMSPSAVDLELRAIEIVDDNPSPADLHRVALFMSFLEGKLRGSCDFELLQAVTHRFLAIHGSAISSFPQLRAKLPALREAQASSWQRLDELFQSIRCVVDFIASS